MAAYPLNITIFEYTSSRRFGGYYLLHDNSVIAAEVGYIAVYSSTKATAQIWRLLSPAYEVRYCSIFFHQNNSADLTATIPSMKNRSMQHNILPSKQFCFIGGYKPLQMMLVIAVNTTNKATA